MSESKGTLRAREHELPPVEHADEGSRAGSIGAYLKRQRLLRGLTVEDLAVTTRIPLRSLERLEAGYFDGVTDGFVRGFVRTVAIALGLDADQTVARMLEEPAASQWDRQGGGIWRKQVIALVALVLATAIVVIVARAGWRLLVGNGPSASREVVVWRDPVHTLARDVAQGRFPPATASSPEERGDGPPDDAPEPLPAGDPIAEHS
ncbi:MAG: helix-turn-helix transcriptional regulator [Myxococcota bacterium]